jgi:hypothetical protein
LQAPKKVDVSLKPPRFLGVELVDTNSLFFDASIGERVLGVKKNLTAGCCGWELREGDRDILPQALPMRFFLTGTCSTLQSPPISDLHYKWGTTSLPLQQLGQWLKQMVIDFRTFSRGLRSALFSALWSMTRLCVFQKRNQSKSI